MPTTGLLKQTLESSPLSSRKSRAVPLVLAASTLLAGCTPRQARDEYASQEDCRKDWERPELCQPATGINSNNSSNGGSGGGHGGAYFGRYYGPSYDADDRAGAQRSVRSGGSSLGFAGGESNHSVARSVSRGGFGGAHISSAGG
ncbi:hypothetical protein GN109_01850 [Collimonas pratensis]|uniref:Uncharacterized protein n=1 Tax=Collimonas pratensis TaxID=279113 RepID=A0A127Q0L3_9BURK|nr:hypothetical protein [Collimonas pratensis]AMP03598.1 hypothetical protein CPter91_1215 [Collimonas pratensis]NKI68149.1 hypothetical protein [Collimonas pratensis]